MTKTIILTDLVVDYIHADYENQRVLVGYRMIDADGVKWEGGEAIFWVTMPPRTDGKGFSSSGLVILRPWSSSRADADQALTDRFLV